MSPELGQAVGMGLGEALEPSSVEVDEWLRVQLVTSRGAETFDPDETGLPQDAKMTGDPGARRAAEARRNLPGRERSAVA